MQIRVRFAKIFPSKRLISLDGAICVSVRLCERPDLRKNARSVRIPCGRALGPPFVIRVESGKGETKRFAARESISRNFFSPLFIICFGSILSGRRSRRPRPLRVLLRSGASVSRQSCNCARTVQSWTLRARMVLLCSVFWGQNGKWFADGRNGRFLYCFQTDD